MTRFTHGNKLAVSGMYVRCTSLIVMTQEKSESPIKQDLKALQQITVEETGKRLAIRSQCKGVCGKVFQSVGVALPPTIKEV